MTENLELFVKINVYIPADEFEQMIDNPCIVARDVVYGIQGMTPSYKELIADLMLDSLRKKIAKNKDEND